MLHWYDYYIYSTDRKKVTIIVVRLSRFRFSFILADTLRLPLRKLPSVLRTIFVQSKIVRLFPAAHQSNSLFRKLATSMLSCNLGGKNVHVS